MGIVYSPIIKKAKESQGNSDNINRHLIKYTSVLKNNGSSINSINEVAKIAQKSSTRPIAMITPTIYHRPIKKVEEKKSNTATAETVSVPQEEIIEKNSIKKVIYTCVTGGYDNIKDPKVISPGFDYVCFTDNPNTKSKVWEIRPIPEGLEELSNVKKQRYVKVNAHKVLPEYELSIWVDGCMELRGDVNKLIATIAKGYSLYIPQHPVRNCLYRESEACAKLKKDDPKIMNAQMERYKKEGFPTNYGLPQSNIIIRRHNHSDCIKIMETWWEEIKNGSHRDQLSFNYAAWKNKDVKFTYLDKRIYSSKWFLWNGRHAKTTKK